MLRVWRRLFGLCDRTVREDIEFDEDTDTVVAYVRPKSKWRRRCGRCGRRLPGYVAGESRRRWRGLDLGTIKVALEAEAPRVACRTHGVTVAQVPWARQGLGTPASSTTPRRGWHCSASGPRSPHCCGSRGGPWAASSPASVAEIDATVDRLDGLSRIGIDEISYKRGHRLLTVVVDHDSGRLVWAQPGRDKATVRAFCDQLGPARSAQITHVSADQAD